MKQVLQNSDQPCCYTCKHRYIQVAADGHTTHSACVLQMWREVREYDPACSNWLSVADRQIERQ